MSLFPEDEFEKIESYQEFDLKGRFIPRRHDGRIASFHIEVNSDGLAFEQVVISSLKDVQKQSDDEAERQMMEEALLLAKKRIDQDDFEDGSRYEERRRING